ncbi:resolvase [Leptolyngbya sp. BL0902]|uniref:resolvase n=1 Tax=Leptolyngbya sp. BL0902 TaxID=1115757 RepID=UPI001CECC9EC|nr:resolvase [Leptolyngbya sp. BL0902]
MNDPNVSMSGCSTFASPDPGISFSTPEPGLTIDDVQRHLNRSRASVYRYANTDPALLNPPYNPQKLNPELRQNKDEPLLFRAQEVRRFAEEVLGLQPIIQVQPAPETATNDLLRQILAELKAIRQHLERQD